MRLSSSFSTTVWGCLVWLLALATSTATVATARPKPVPHHGRIFIPKMLPTVLPEAREGYQTVLRGSASWYGKFFQGMETASGERYDRFQWTCAHKKLPFGTRLRVTNVNNGVTVVVRVTDRGPFRKERIIDLSEKAARPLGLVQAGSAKIIAVVVPSDTPLGLTDTPADLAALRAADPRPQAPFTAYLLPIVQQVPQVLAAVDKILPAIALAAAPAADADKQAPFQVQTGLFADAGQAQLQVARIQYLDPKLTGSLEAIMVNGKPMKRVFIGQLDSWLAAETVRRNLQVWGIAGVIRSQTPEEPPLPMPATDGDTALLSTIN